MDSFIYEDKEIECFCFETKAKNRNGLRSIPTSSDQRESLKNRGAIKSVE